MATPAERALAIWDVLGARIGRSTTYTLNGVAITATLAGVNEAAGSVTLTCSATTGSGQNKVNLPLEDGLTGVFVFVNPPTGVATQEQVGHWAGVPLISEYVVDVPHIVSATNAASLAAAKQMVYEAVTASARSYGWGG